MGGEGGGEKLGNAGIWLGPLKGKLVADLLLLQTCHKGWDRINHILKVIDTDRYIQ